MKKNQNNDFDGNSLTQLDSIFTSTNLTNDKQATRKKYVKEKSVSMNFKHLLFSQTTVEVSYGRIGLWKSSATSVHLMDFKRLLTKKTPTKFTWPQGLPPFGECFAYNESSNPIIGVGDYAKATYTQREKKTRIKLWYHRIIVGLETNVQISTGSGLVRLHSPRLLTKILWVLFKFKFRIFWSRYSIFFQWDWWI